MNPSRSLRSIVCRLFGSQHTTAVVNYRAYSQKIFHQRQDLIMAASYLIRRNFTIINEMKSELNRTREVYDGDIPTLKYFVSQLPSQKEYVSTLMKALGCSKKDLREIQRENVYWRSIPIDVILERIKAYEELGVTKEDLMKHSSLLFSNFETAFKILSSTCEILEYNGHMLLPMVLMPEAKLTSYLKNVSIEAEVLGEYKNRIKFFSDKLQIPVRRFTEELLVHSYLLTLPVKRMIDMMNALLEANVNRIDIFRDLWVFKCNMKQTRQRLEACNQAELEIVKPWVVRAPEERFRRCLQDRTAKRAMIRGLPWVDFVAERLNCSVEEVEAMTKYNERVLKVTHLKALKIIEYLLSEGFTSKDVLQSPHVFCSSLRMLQKRLKMMKDAGLDPRCHSVVLRRMTLSNKAFLDTFKKYFVNYDCTFAQKET